MASLNKLSKLNVGDQRFFLLLSSQPGKDQFNLTLSDGARSWSGKIVEKEFKLWSEKTKLKVDDYKAHTLKALSGESFNGRKFEYDVQEENDRSVNLTWKRVLDDEDVKFQLGCVNLRADTNLASSMSRILESSIELTLQLQKQILSVTEERDRLASERATALKRLEKCVSVKVDTETDLYSKFVVVLNDKKAKIRELKRQVEMAQPGTSKSLPTQSTSGSRKGHSSRAENSEDDSGSDDHAEKVVGPEQDELDAEYNTDDQLKQSLSGGKDRQQRKKLGAERKKREDDDDGLILDDGMGEDDDDNIPAFPKRTRKTRKEETTVRKTLKPTNSVSASVEARPSASRKGSLRKSSTKGSSHNLDVNNLIDDMD